MTVLLALLTTDDVTLDRDADRRRDTEESDGIKCPAVEVDTREAMLEEDRLRTRIWKEFD